MIIKYISVIFGATFEIYYINTFVSAFSERKIINKLLFWIILTAVSLCHILAPLFISGIALAALSILIVFIITQLYKSKQYIKWILTIGISAISIASELAVNGLLMLINQDNYYATNADDQLYSIGLLLSKFIAFFILTAFRVGRKKFDVDNLSRKYLIILSILPITTIFIGVLMYQVILIIGTASLKTIFVFANMLLIISNIITFEIIRQQNILAKSEYELKLLKGNVDDQIKHYENLLVSQDETRQLRHDYRNTCIGIISELKAGKIECAIEQLQNCFSNIDSVKKTIDTGHPSIDGIIESKLKECDKLNIECKFSFNYKEPLSVNEIEISLIIGNILDNAIEACKKIDSGRKIWGMINTDKENIVINIKNTALGSNNLETSKPDKNSHGYGLKNITHIANKYKGKTSFTFENNIFTSYVILAN